MEDADNYTYMPATLYEHVTRADDQGYSYYEPIKHEHAIYQPHEPRDLSVRADYPHAIPGPNWDEDHHPGRYHTVTSSHGWYPTGLD